MLAGAVGPVTALLTDALAELTPVHPVGPVIFEAVPVGPVTVEAAPAVPCAPVHPVGPVMVDAIPVAPVTEGPV